MRIWIEMSAHILEHPQCRETFLHEVAHAWCDHLGMTTERHGWRWKSKARALGCTRPRKTTRVAFLDGTVIKCVGVCERCGVKVHRVRRWPKTKTVYHTRCGGLVRHV